MNLRLELFNNQDLKYKEFHSKLLPNVNSDKIIGVRIPTLRKLAKSVAKEKINFDKEYYEEYMVWGMSIGYSRCTIDEYIAMLTAFVPCIDNWAVCDCVCATLKFTNEYKSEMWEFISSYIDSSEYEVRFMAVMMMTYYLTDDYIDDVLSVLVSIHRDEYYINMAIAWALATAMAKYPEKVIPIIESKSLDTFVHNKTIQKARESFRISDDTKEYLKTIKK